MFCNLKVEIPVAVFRIKGRPCHHHLINKYSRPQEKILIVEIYVSTPWETYIVFGFVVCMIPCEHENF